MLERVCFPSSFSSLHHLSSWEAMKAFFCFFARWLPSVSFYKVGFLLAVEPAGSDFRGWYRHWSRRIHEKHKSKDRGYFFFRDTWWIICWQSGTVCVKKWKADLFLQKCYAMIFGYNNIALRSTRISQITPSSCCGSCCYQDREWALTFEVTFKVWLQHQSCQCLSRTDIYFCASAKKNSVGFYGSSFVKVKEDIFFFWTRHVCKGGHQNDEQLGSCQIIWPDPWHQKAGHSMDCKLSLEKGKRIPDND